MSFSTSTFLIISKLWILIFFFYENYESITCISKLYTNAEYSYSYMVKFVQGGEDVLNVTMTWGIKNVEFCKDSTI